MYFNKFIPDIIHIIYKNNIQSATVIIIIKCRNYKIIIQNISL